MAVILAGLGRRRAERQLLAPRQALEVARRDPHLVRVRRDALDVVGPVGLRRHVGRRHDQLVVVLATDGDVADVDGLRRVDRAARA